MSTLHLMSDEQKSAYKAQKLKDIRDYHSDLINDLQITMYDFNMKSKFRDEQGRLVVGLFASEFRKPKGFFFEMVDSDLNPIDPNRTVYRVPPSDSYAEEYEMNSRGSFLVPVDELRVVNPSSVAISRSSAVTSSDDIIGKSQVIAKSQVPPKPDKLFGNASQTEEDCPYSEMTIRDYYAMMSGRPVSNKKWLNDLIKSA